MYQLLNEYSAGNSTLTDVVLDVTPSNAKTKVCKVFAAAPFDLDTIIGSGYHPS